VIGYLKGIPFETKPSETLLLVGEVGYELTISLSLYERIRGRQEAQEVWVYTQHKEDSFRLFGFVSKEEKNFFARLLQLQGVGPSLAMAIVSSVEHERFYDILQKDEPAHLQKIPGVGQSKAERILFEYKKKYKKWQQEGARGGERLAPPGPGPKGGADAELEDALEGLVALGYDAGQARQWLNQARYQGGGEQGAGELIRYVLQNMAK
jgi:Holliday junction DNA helicase RuvA